jgi:hypothetical protein
MRFHYKAADCEMLQYVDVMSLYHYICKHFNFHIGHPVIHAGDDCVLTDALLQEDGLLKCTILPPKHLFHPVLQFRCDNRLVFCLCRSCAIQQNSTGDCNHETVDERALTGTWVLDEIRLAVQHGYELVEVHEVYKYQVTSYDTQTGDGGLFVQYINEFLKLKAKSSDTLIGCNVPQTRTGTLASFRRVKESCWIDTISAPTPLNVALPNSV